MAIEYGDEERPVERMEVIDCLRAMPGRLRAALTRDAAGRPRGAADAYAWTARDVFDHVRATDVLHAAEIFMIVAASEPALPSGDERALAESAGFTEDDPQTALAAYATRRRELVRLLERLDDAGWRRAGVHPAWGRVTIERYARHIVAHEADHFAQIDRALGDR